MFFSKDKLTHTSDVFSFSISLPLPLAQDITGNFHLHIYFL